jgi:hypothetical protein
MVAAACCALSSRGLLHRSGSGNRNQRGRRTQPPQQAQLNPYVTARTAAAPCRRCPEHLRSGAGHPSARECQTFRLCWTLRAHHTAYVVVVHAARVRASSCCGAFRCAAPGDRLQLCVACMAYQAVGASCLASKQEPTLHGWRVLCSALLCPVLHCQQYCNSKADS